MFALRSIAILGWVLLPILVALPARALQSRIEDRINQPEPKKKAAKVPNRVTWNLDGGVFFATDGHLQNGSCFRLSGHLTAPDFFDGLRRVASSEGTLYTRQNKPVFDFPPEVQVAVHVLDFPCTTNLRDSTVRPPLTREIMSTLRLNFFWKNHLALRPVESSQRTAADATQIVPFAQQAEDLAPRFEWSYLFTVKSAGVPLTDDLVLTIEEPDGKIAARVAARL